MSAFADTLLVGVADTAELREVFAESRMFGHWLAFEAALAAAQAETGAIPRPAAAAIRAACRIETLDLAALAAEQRRTNHPMIPFLRQLVERCGAAGAYVHWGATTQDVIDCGLVLQVREALRVLGRDLVAVSRSLARLARRYRDAVMPGRTHSQHALPTTFGLKVAIWLAECLRHVARLEQLRGRVLVGQLGGAVGTMAGFGDDAHEVQALVMRALELGTPIVPWHTSRDGFAELVHWTALVGATLGKIANEIITLQRTEVGEVEEPFAEGNVGSSTMPHKRNPFACNKVVASAMLLRELPASMLAAMSHLHERDGAVWSVEHATVPRAACALGAALSTTLYILDGLVVHPEKMRANLELGAGTIASEAVMLELARTIGREHAHQVVYRAAMRAHAEHRPFRMVLAEDPAIAKSIPPEQLARVLDPAAYLGRAGEMVDAALLAASRVLATSADRP